MQDSPDYNPDTDLPQSPPQPGWWQFLTGLYLAGLMAFVCWVGWRSLTWTYTHDTSIMLYMGYLIESLGRVPYRDFFDMNMPGSYLFYAVMGHLFGYEEVGVRTADLVTLGAVVFATVVMMRRFGWAAALTAAFLFSLRYLFYGPGMTLQREYVMLIPLALGVGAAISWPRVPLSLRAFLSAFFFATAMTIKPHVFIGFPLVLLFLLFEQRRPGWRLKNWTLHTTKVCTLALLGGLVPVGTMFAWLYQQGVTEPFLDTMLKYVPLYSSMTGNHTTIEGAARWDYLRMNYWRLGGQTKWVVLAVFVVYAAYAAAVVRVPQRRRVVLLGALALIFSLYPCFSGQFWNYHWLPFVYFLICCVALTFQPYPTSATFLQRALPLAVLLYMTYTFSGAPNDFSRWERNERYVSKSGRSERIAAFLKDRLEEGDTVQPIDWVGTGVVEGMLLARAELATPFVYHFHFYHHISNPFIQELRERYLAAFREAKPRFVVEGKLKRPFVRGHDTAHSFSESDTLIRTHYERVLNTRSFTIWERKDTDWAQTDVPGAEPAPESPSESSTDAVPTEAPPAVPTAETIPPLALQQETQARPMNVLLILIDSLRADHLGAYGYHRPMSPFLDKLASEAVVFENAASVSSYTRESVASLFTGLLPSIGGAKGWEARPAPETKTLAEHLAAHGYRTAAISNSIMIRHPDFMQGFDQSVFPGQSQMTSGNGPRLTARALDFLDEVGASPFFLYTHYLDPHGPYEPPPAYRALVDVPPVPEPVALYGGARRNASMLAAEGFGPGEARFEDMVARYDAELKFVDDTIAALLEGLKSRDLYDNTLIILTADHGEEFMDHAFLEHAWTLYEESLHVPLVFHAPSMLQPRRASSRVSLVDVSPTVTTLLGLPPLSTSSDGVPLLAQRDGTWTPGKSSTPRVGELLIQTRHLLRSFTEREWKYIAGWKWTTGEERDALVAAQPTLRRALAGGNLDIVDTINSSPTHEELYNLAVDPQEEEDLSALHPEVLERFRKHLKAFQERAGATGIEQADEEGPLTEERAAELEALGYL
jgi:arylsulfatase